MSSGIADMLEKRLILKCYIVLGFILVKAENS